MDQEATGEADEPPGPSFTQIASKDVVLAEKDIKVLVGNKKTFALGHVLGKGVYGKVKEAIETTKGNKIRLLAVKIVPKRKLRKIPNGEAAVKREIEFLRSLAHDNIVGYVDSFTNEEKGKLYILTEYAGAGTLQDLCDGLLGAGSKLPLYHARRFFSQLVEGVRHLHDAGIVHRDIKPENLLLCRDGTLKISDFGSALRLEDDISQQGIGFTPAFQPPEIAVGTDLPDDYDGRKIDMWSIGVTLFFLGTGAYPFVGETIYLLFEQIEKGEYEIPADVRPALKSLIKRLLSVDFSKRLTATEALEHRWLGVKLDVPKKKLALPRSPTMFAKELKAAKSGKKLTCTLQ